MGYGSKRNKGSGRTDLETAGGEEVARKARKKAKMEKLREKDKDAVTKDLKVILDTKSYQYRKLPIGDVVPNKWNPNKMTPFIRERLQANLEKFKQTIPILVRTGNQGGPFPDGKIEIIDGEHRHAVMKELGFKSISVMDLGNVPDNVAKTMTINSNEVRGEADSDMLGDLLKTLRDDHDDPALLDTLPFDAEELDAYAAAAEVGLEELDELGEESGQEGGGDEEVVDSDDTLESVLGIDTITDTRFGQVLERIKTVGKKVNTGGRPLIEKMLDMIEEQIRAAKKSKKKEAAATA